MKVKRSQEVNVPQEYAFAVFTDANALIRRLPDKVSVRNPQGLNRFEKGSLWHVKVQRAGRVFKIANVIKNVVEPSKIEIESESNRVKISTVISINKVAENKCEITFDANLTPKGLLGRVLLRTLRSSRKRFNSGADGSMTRMAQRIEEQYQNDGH